MEAENTSHSIKLPFTYYTFSNVPDDDTSKINQHLWEQEQHNHDDEEEQDVSWLLNIQEINCFTMETCIRMLFRSNKSTDQIYKLIIAERNTQYEKPKYLLEYPILEEENGTVWKEDIFKISSHLVHKFCEKIHHQQQTSSTQQVFTVVNEMNQFLLKDSLSDKEKNQFTILEDLICNKLYGGVLFHWYGIDENFWGHVYPFLQHQCKGVISSWIVPRWQRKKKCKQIQTLLKPYFPHGLNEDRMLDFFTFMEHTLACITSHLQARMNNSSNGHSFLFHNEKPCILDIYLYSFLSALLLSHFSDARLVTLARKFCPTLSLYCKHITQIYYPEEEDWIQNLSTISQKKEEAAKQSTFNRVIQRIYKENEEKIKSKYWNRIFLYTVLGAITVPLARVLLRELAKELNDEIVVTEEEV